MKNPVVVAIISAVVTVFVLLILLVMLMPMIGPRFLHPMMMAGEGMHAQNKPQGLDTATTKPSDAGNFVLGWASESGRVPLNQIHSWVVTVIMADGTPVEDAIIVVDGGMPQHGHGLPTQPQVTQYLGNGQYLVEGLRFQMPGWWEVRFGVTSDNTTDSVTFNLVME